MHNIQKVFSFFSMFRNDNSEQDGSTAYCFYWVYRLSAILSGCAFFSIPAGESLFT
jgi:hypothetical protein